MDKLKRVSQLPVDFFNRELDRIIRGSAVSEEEYPPGEAPVLKLAMNLAEADFSDSSTIQKSLRSRFSKRSLRDSTRLTYAGHRFYLREGRALAGIGVAGLLTLSLILGLFVQQHVSATPANIALPASAGLHELPEVSLTAAASHYQSINPKPVPTPMAISAFSRQSTTLPDRTPSVTIHPWEAGSLLLPLRTRNNP